MVSKYYIVIIILITILIFSFSFNSEYKYKSLEHSLYPIIEGAEPLDPTEYIQTTTKLLINAPIKPLKKNWAVTFTVELKSVNGGPWWPQIIGISPYKDGEGRLFAAWLCPNSNRLHFRTATKGLDGYFNWNDSILGDLDCNLSLPLNQTVRFDIVANDIGNGKQIISTYMQNISNGETSPTLIKTNNMNSGYFTPSNGFNEAWIMTSYPSYVNKWNVIDGTVKDVGFTTGDSPMQIMNLKNATAYADAVSTKNGFTTMGGATTEGYSNIGGLGNNGGIIGIAPPTNSVPTSTSTSPPYNGVSPARNYNPITDSLGLPICTKSVVQPTDANLNTIEAEGYNFYVTKGSDSYNGSGLNNDGTVPICSPDDLYLIQTRILRRINDFNAEYSDYMTYLYNKKVNQEGNKSPKLKYKTKCYDSREICGADYNVALLNDTTAEQRYSNKATVQSLDTYGILMRDLHTYNNLLAANKAYYPDPEASPASATNPLERADPTILGNKHKEIMNFRNDLDKKLFELNNIQNSAEGESRLQMDSSVYINLLWTTLATCVIYFMFV